MSALEILQLGGILLTTKSCSLSFAAKKGALYESNEKIDNLIIQAKLILNLNLDEKTELRINAKNYISNYHNEDIAFKKFKELYF